jgi:urease accessory protein
MVISPEEKRGERLPAGTGVLRIERVGTRSVVTRALGTAPLKLLLPRGRERAVWVYTSTLGGGLVAGDRIRLDLTIGRGAVCCLTTQSATKVYRSPDGAFCEQTLSARVAPGGILVLSPDPVICFREAAYRERQDIEVEEGGALALINWATSGRRERGERWSFRSFESRLEVRHRGALAIAEGLFLSPADGPLCGPFRLGRFHCLAMAVLLGDRLAVAARQLCQEVEGRPVARQAALVESASPLGDGAVYRILGSTPEEVGTRMKERLCFLAEVLGDPPWARKC